MPPTTDAPTLRSRLDGVAGLQALARAPRGIVAGVPSGAVGLIAWWLREATGRSVLVLSPEAETVWSDTTAWAGDAGVVLFPAADTLPFDRVAPGEEVTRHRLATLATLASPAPAIVVAAPGGLVRPTLPPALVRRGLRLRRGETVPLTAVVERLVALGYRREPAVSVPGEFSVRGGIVDAFPPDRSRPWRAEWFGDEVEGLRAFDVATQTSVAQLEEVGVPPARELDLTPDSVTRALDAVRALDLEHTRPEIRDDWVRDIDRLGAGAYGEGIDLFTPYLQTDPPTTLVDHLDNPITLVAGGRERWDRAVLRYLVEAEGLRAQEEQRSELPRGARSGLLEAEAAAALVDGLAPAELVREAVTEAAVDLGWRGADGYVGRFDALAAEVRRRLDAGRCQLVLSRQEHRVAELAAEQGLDPVAAEE
ncbi:MAG TPA: hypothetical protein VF112_01550, partial [Candidatus Dormibacteraeota bacterium]